MQDIFGFIIHPLELGVIGLSVLVNSAGIGIILFTIFVRLVLAPLLITQLRSSKAMQRIQPLVMDLRKKHGKDRKALSEATMALYKEHKVNPAMGCLPTLLQFPILIGLFYAFLHLGDTLPSFAKGAKAVTCGGHVVHNAAAWYAGCYRVANAASNPHHIYQLFHAHFLWLSNGLGQPDPLFILPLLAGATQWLQSRMMLQRSDDPQQKMMNTMMNFMPLLIVFFATRYASGLSLYWVTSTTIAIAIQYRITGWGLVPRPAAVMAMLNGATAARPRSGATTKPRATSVPPKAKNSARSNSAGATQLAATPEPTSEVVLNGQDDQNGAREQSPRTAATGPRKPAAMPRKKANRAKGGRGGGRRG